MMLQVLNNTKGACCILATVAILTYYCCKLLLDCKKKYSTVLCPLDTYGKVGGAVMGDWIVYWIDGLVVGGCNRFS